MRPRKITAVWSAYLSETWARVLFYPCRAHLMRCFVGVWCVRGRGEPRQRAHSHRAGTRGAAAEPRLALYPAFLCARPVPKASSSVFPVRQLIGALRLVFCTQRRAVTSAPRTPPLPQTAGSSEYQDHANA